LRTSSVASSSRQTFFEARQISLRQLPYDGRHDAFVVVAQHLADARHFLPRNFRMMSFQFIREVAARLGNNLDAALDEPLPLPISLKNIERHIAQHGIPNPKNCYSLSGALYPPEENSADPKARRVGNRGAICSSGKA
jgi:hypothetical protein